MVTPPTNANPADVQLIVFDVDGVLTDGSLYLDDDGRQAKAFHVRDGFAMRAAMSVGLQVAILTGRTSRVVQHRADELGIELLIQGSKDKAADVTRIAERARVDLCHAAFMGDDLIDLPAMAAVGYPIAVADAAEPTRQAAAFVTQAPGGRAAAREAIEHILVAQGKWQTIIDRYTPSP